ncbi:hypothetical protein J6590_084796 [Homalodisca vitripennis]|nr:hypothetical protein J6590_084796 [Homalodisca vitripennis]
MAEVNDPALEGGVNSILQGLCVGVSVTPHFHQFYFRALHVFLYVWYLLTLLLPPWRAARPPTAGLDMSASLCSNFVAGYDRQGRQ